MQYRSALQAIFGISSTGMPQCAGQLHRRATAPLRHLLWTGAALCTALSAKAGTEALPLPAPRETTAVALLCTPDVTAAQELQSAAPAPRAPHGATSHDGSHVPTPVDNPWALGLLAALAARILGMDRHSKQDSG